MHASRSYVVTAVASCNAQRRLHGKALELVKIHCIALESMELQQIYNMNLSTHKDNIDSLCSHMNDQAAIRYRQQIKDFPDLIHYINNEAIELDKARQEYQKLLLLDRPETLIDTFQLPIPFSSYDG